MKNQTQRLGIFTLTLLITLTINNFTMANPAKSRQLNPTMVDTYISMAEMYYHAKQYNKGSEYYDMVLKSYPAHTEALLGKVKCLLAMAEYPKALETLEILEEIDPGNATGLLYKGKVFIHQEKYTDAVQVLQQSVEADGENPEAFTLLSNIYRVYLMDKSSADYWQQRLDKYLEERRLKLY